MTERLPWMMLGNESEVSCRLRHKAQLEHDDTMSQSAVEIFRLVDKAFVKRRNGMADIVQHQVLGRLLEVALCGQ